MPEKILIVGQAPGRGNGPPLEGSSMRRLCRWAGVPWEVYLAKTERVNLFLRFPGKAGKGDRFNLKLARSRARRILAGSYGRDLVLLGRNVAAAFGLDPKFPLFVWRELWIPDETSPDLEPSADVILVPHPSGISHFYNDPANRAAAGEVFRSLVGSATIATHGVPRQP